MVQLSLLIQLVNNYQLTYNTNRQLNEFNITIEKYPNFLSFVVFDKVGDVVHFLLNENNLQIKECTMSQNRINYMLRYLLENWKYTQLELEYNDSYNL